MIGGLLFATVATLFFVPVVFCLIRGRRDGETETRTNEDAPKTA